MALFHTTVLDNQIKALPTVSTASGSIATFDTDMTENLIDVECEIVYSQAEGTPSPDNPLAIQTFSEMNVRTRNKNFISLVDDTVQTDRKTSITINSITNNSIDMTSGGSAYACFGRFLFLKSGTYTVSLKATSSDSYSPTATIYKSSSVIVSGINNTTPKTFTITTDGIYELRMFATGSGDTTIRTVYFYDIQIEKGSNDTAYEPFNGNTYNIPFGQAVANGVLDVTTGKLRVTWGACNLADLAWVQNTYNPSIFNGTLPSRCKSTNILSFKSSEYVSTDSTTALTLDNCVAISSARTVVYCHDERYTNVTDFKNGVTALLIYELDTPYDIQLDSTQITALLNENNIWCDTNGDTEVKYLLTVGKKIA